MKHVDALSRVAWLLIEDSLHHRLRREQLNDEWAQAVMKAIESGNYKDYYIQGGVLRKDPVKELVVVPASMEEEIIKVAHDQGHFSAKRTKEAVEKNFYIPQLSTKADKIVRSCVKCILMNNKAGKKEGFLSPIDKEDQPLGTYHIDHVGPMEQTQKWYNHLLVVVDAFSKFVWLYPTRSTGAEEVVKRLTGQAAIFGNPKRVITDRGAAFTSHIFKDYCVTENIKHLLITTGVPRGNGQVERIHKIVVPMIAKLSAENPRNWYRYVDRVQQTLNSVAPRSTRYSPMKLLTGVEMRTRTQPELTALLREEAETLIQTERDEMRERAKDNILTLQEENSRQYNSKRKEDVKYEKDDLVAIRRTQFGTRMKLRPKFLGPYKVTKVLKHGRYEVTKVGEHEGPHFTSTEADFMKRWCVDKTIRGE